ncbi:dihydrofolate reductase family protein [Peristeroidobacter agariperforans]|uniref:dihydrofolate reductase family protein n=1 Tax=Peristeroidobacter agariperforans TaxID=268404 RepID=UPI00101CA566|nr:dihydrofolate reductase family protein [Peristeroidobacter agariperforans]
MGKVRVNFFCVSLDGFGAGPDQSLEQPLGIGGESLHEWAFGTRTFQKMLFGKESGSTGIDDDFLVRSFDNLGAWIMGRNMFGPIRGRWPDEDWKGWWGSNPPYRSPVFVLTNHPRAPLSMEGGTTFHFVTDGVHAALERAQAAANGKDIRVLGGASTIRQYLQAQLIDEMHLVVVPKLLGRGEPLLMGLDLVKLGYSVTRQVASETVLHVVVTKI